MYEYVAIIESVHDGDTFRARIDLGFGVWIANEAFRLTGINAPELGTAKGKPSRDELRRLMPVGSRVVIRTHKDGREKYGRYLATVTAAEGDVATSLIASGHALPWDGTGQRPV